MNKRNTRSSLSCITNSREISISTPTALYYHFVHIIVLAVADCYRMSQPAIAPILGNVKHAPPTEIYTIFGVEFTFSYSIAHLSLLAFMFTYLNIVVLFEFGVYPSLMTGNYFTMAVNITNNLYSEALYRLVLIVSCTLLGTALDCYLLVKFNSRENAFGFIMLALIPSVVLVDQVGDRIYNSNQAQYTLCLLCIISGALVHWTQKLGYNCTAMTGNMFKLAELGFCWWQGYNIGGPQMHGEVLILFAIFFWSLVGATLAVVIIKFTSEAVELIPLLICVVPNLYLGGCFKEWGWLKSEPDEPTDEEQSEGSVASETISALHRDTGSSSMGALSMGHKSTDSASVGRPSRFASTASRLSNFSAEVFTKRTLSVEEAKELEEVDVSATYRKQRAAVFED